MNKNIKRMFFVTTLLLLIVSITALSATDANNDTTGASQQDVVKEVNVEKVSNTQVTDTTSKNIKKEAITTDLYVSDTDGSDDNSGTQTSPYKTIQKALDTTNSDSTFNIHILEGTYKGLGNTNLTVNGNYNINFIGDGINKTVIDGEVQYTVEGASVWGQDSYWDYYNLISGNWGMNISEGTGHVTLNNMNFQHMLTTVYGDLLMQNNFLGTVTNYGNLSVDNVLFYQNLGGLGAGIQNKADATLYVNNSIFQENRKSSGTGNFGAGIYNNGTAVVENSQFIQNAARWGTITNDHIITVNNCTLRDGISYDLGSTFKFGSGIASNTGDADYYNLYNIDGIVTIINNSHFENNGMSDVYMSFGNLTVTNSVFNYSTGITINPLSEPDNDQHPIQIINNTMDNMRASTYSTSLSQSTGSVRGIFSNGEPALIKNNTISIEGDGYSIYLGNNAKYNIIEDNILNSKVYVMGFENNITKNIITTQDKSTIELDWVYGNIITNNTLNALIYSGDKSIETTTEDNIIENNLPTSPDDLELSDETYPNLFNEDGTIKTTIPNGTMINIVGDVNNKNMTLENIKVGFKGVNGKLNNVSITVKENANTVLDSVTINNTNSNPYTVLFESENNLITNSNININTTSPISVILIKADYNKIIKNTFRVYGPNTNTTGFADTIIVDIQSSKNTLLDNDYILWNSTEEDASYNIAIKIQKNNTRLTNNIINDARISFQQTSFIHVYMENSDNNSISNANEQSYIVNSSGIGYYLVDSDNNIIGSPCWVRGNEVQDAYGIIIEGKNRIANNNTVRLSTQTILQGKNSTAIKVINANNTLLSSANSASTLSGINGSAIEIDNCNNTKISYINVWDWTITDDTSSIIKIRNSENTKITDMKTGHKTGPFAYIENSTNTTIGDEENLESVTIETKDTAIIIKNSTQTRIQGIKAIVNNSVAIELENSNNNSIINNYLQAENNYGNDAVHQTGELVNEIIDNRPDYVKLTDDNYAEYFTDGVYNRAIQPVIEVASDINNKTLTFNNPNTVIFTLNNYTINSGKIEFTPEATGSNITNITIKDSQIKVEAMKCNVLNINTVDTSIMIDEDNVVVQNSNITSTTDKLEIIIDDARNVNITNNRIVAENQKNKNPITTINSKVTIRNNYILTNDTQNILGITNIDSTLIISNNNPTPLLTDDNYNKFFDENGIYNVTGLSEIHLGSDIYNKNMTFNTPITLNNPDNYIIYNTTITNTILQELIIQDLIINNTDYPYPTIIAAAMSLIRNTIYASGNNIKVIIFETNDELMGTINENRLNTNNITCEGNNNTIISCNEVGFNNFVYNNIIGNGSNITALHYDSVPTTFDYEIVMGEDGEMQFIMIEGPMAVNIWDNNITLYANTPATAIVLENYTGNLYQNQIIINTTNGETPIIHASNSNETNIYNNYIESLDLCGDNAVSTDGTKYGNKPNNEGEYKVNINIDKENIVYNHKNNIKVNITNMFNEEITGEITATSNNQPLEVIDNTIIFTPTKQTFNPPTTTFTNIMENQTITKATKISKSTSINNCTINITQASTLTASNSLALNKNQICLINNTQLNTPLYNQGTIYIYNSILNGTYRNSGGTLYVDDNTIIGENFKFYSTSNINIFTNNKQLLETLKQNNIIPLNNPQITITYTDPTGKYETTTITKTFTIIEPTITVDPITATTGDTINITARITAGDETITDINLGKITFKINGKTLKDANGKVIYAKVVNGTATIEDYTVPSDWTKEGTTIQAVYSGSKQCEKLTSEKTNITVTKATPTLTTTDITATAGETITLTATITDGDNAINTGKVVFKINGKTVKDANGKVIYAKVTNNQANVTYTLPENMKANDYNITAVFTSSNYDKLEDVKTLTVTA